MKILHFISGGDTGGAKNHVFTLLTNLKERNIDVELLCIMESSFTEEARKLGLKVTVIPQVKRYDLTVNQKICRYINESGCDLLHCHGARANFIVMFIMKKIRVPAITTIHSNYKLDFKGNRRKQMLYTPMNAMALKKFRHMLCVTQNLKDIMVENGFRAEYIDVIYNGIYFGPDIQTLSEEDFFKAVGVKRDPAKKYVGIAARLNAIKGFDIFLRSAELTSSRRNDIDYLILGGGELWDECQSFIKEKGLTDRVHMPGMINDPVIMNSFYKYIDINTLSSYSEGFPYALLEGARMKTATVSTNVGGIPEMITDGKTGYLVPSGDAEAFAEKIELLCSDDELRRHMGEAFYEDADARFSVKSMIDTHIDIYSRIIAEEGRR